MHISLRFKQTCWNGYILTVTCDRKYAARGYFVGHYNKTKTPNTPLALWVFPWVFLSLKMLESRKCSSKKIIPNDPDFFQVESQITLQISNSSMPPCVWTKGEARAQQSSLRVEYRELKLVLTTKISMHIPYNTILLRTASNPMGNTTLRLQWLNVEIYWRDFVDCINIVLCSCCRKYTNLPLQVLL